MIKDAQALDRIRTDWNGLQNMCDYLRHLLDVTIARRGVTAPALADVLYNLPVMLAFDVLADTLSQLRDEQVFLSRARHLGPLVNDAKDSLVWIDWQIIRDGVHRRNAIAHDGTLHDAKTCVSDIQTIEKQLVAWAVIDPAKVERTQYTTTVTPTS